MITSRNPENPNPLRERGTLKSSESLAHETADLGLAFWFMVSRRALARIIHNPKRERGTCKESLAHASGYEKQSVIRRNPATVGTTTLCFRNWKSHELSGLAPVAACGEATKPGLAPNGSLNQQSLTLRVGMKAVNCLAAERDKRTMAL
jgi:hypothetical protein